VTTTLVGDLYPGEARGRVQGWFSSVWGIAAVVGPALGGLLVDRWDWRAVFLINVPLGLIALVLLAAFFHERVQRRHQPVDYAGFALLMGGLTFLLTSLLQSEALERPVPAAGFLASAAVLLAVFAWHERRVPDPMLPRFLFRQRLPAIANAANFLAGAGMTGVTTYLPVFVQGVLGGTATQAGAALTPMSIGWPLGSVLVGRFGRRAGLRRWAAGGAVLEFLAAVLLLRLALDTPLAYVMAVMLVMGLGLGFSTTSLLIAVQNHVPWEGRGAATAAMLFLRNLGAAIGVAAIGAVLNASLQAQLGGAGAGAGVGQVGRLLRPGAALPAGDQGILREALVRSLHRAYGGVALIALAGLAVAFLLPRRALPGGSGRSGTAAPAGFGPAASVGLPAQAPTGRGVNGPRPSTDAGRPEVPRE
ncbi:MAG: MFS transporter, partial [Clostridia bacterium]|nr:MFS transporter [Clostridia bacterium]